MTDEVRARVVALATTPMPELKALWRKLFGKEPPAYKRSFLEDRLAYRIQELAYGGLKPDTIKQLETLGEQLDPGRQTIKDERPVAGTRLVREYQGIAHEVIVHPTCFEYRQMRYDSLSSIARLITGTRWNGWVFFGLRSRGKKA